MSGRSTQQLELHRRPARLFFASAFIALALQLCALGWSFTRRGSWLSNLGGDVNVSGRYIGASQGSWFYANFAKNWPDMFTTAPATPTTPTDPPVIHAGGMGLRYTYLPPFFHVVLVDMRWTLVPNALVVPIWLFTTIRRTRRKRRTARRIEQGLCAECEYNLIHSEDRCPECGHPMDEVAVRAIQRLRTAAETNRLGAPMGC